MATPQTQSETKDSGSGLNSGNSMERAFLNIVCELIEDVFTDVCFSVHRGVKLGYYPVQEHIVKDNEFELYQTSPQEIGSVAFNSKGCDIFGHYKGYKTLLCCPHCHKKLCSSRFAPHLYCCMGFGRRLKKRNSTKRVNPDMFESDPDDENSNDSISPRKRRRGKNTRKRARGRQSDSSAASMFEANYTEMSQEHIRDCLSHMCGVISERTGRFCRNTLKCSMHVDDQRREVRDMLLGSSSTDQAADDIHIDVDTVDEDSHAQAWYSNRKAPKKNAVLAENTSANAPGASML